MPRPDQTHTPLAAIASRRGRLLLTGIVAVVAIAAAVVVVTAVARRQRPPTSTPTPAPASTSLPLRQVGEITLPSDSSRFDYASLDPARGLLFIAHLGASEVIEVDVHAGTIVRTITGLSDVHGVLVVPERRRVYATATGTNEMVIIDEDTGTKLARAPTGAYPDGLAYDPAHGTVWTTNQTGGSEPVIDADTGQVRGTVELGGQAGNVAYDTASGQLLVDVQSRGVLAAIDPATLTVTRRIALLGCQHNHGLALDTADRLAFVACDGNAVLLTVDLNTAQVIDTHTVGPDPDVIVYDTGGHRIYVAAESGQLTILDVAGRRLTTMGSGPLADGAHVVAVDTNTHRSYYPIPRGKDNRPVLLAFDAG